MRFGSILIWVDLVTDDATYGRTIHCTGGASTGQDGARRVRFCIARHQRFLDAATIYLDADHLSVR